MYHTYILFSPTFHRTYVGQAEDLSSRLKKHNAGRVRSTKAYRPWELFHSEEHQTRAEAIKRESWFKTLAGRKKIAEILGVRKALGTGLSDSDC